jgi:integrative and conjugative element protein (TIGR02256 family)
MPGGMTYARVDGGRFHFGAEALGIVLAYIQDEPEKLEAGGVLLGRHLLASNDVVVDAVTVPQPGDRLSRHRFFRSRQTHQTLIDRAWRESGGTCTYLGEWHTHPEPVPSSSPTDRSDWDRKLRIDRVSFSIYFVIVGTTEIKVWEANPRFGLSKLAQV